MELEQQENDNILYAKNIRILTNRARVEIVNKVRYYAAQMEVTYGKITIKQQKTRWGSCSSKGNLNFNCLLMLAPDDVIDYVVVHELSHRIHMNHSKEFWKQVESVIPDYKEKEKWLKDNGVEIIRRVHKFQE